MTVAQSGRWLVLIAFFVTVRAQAFEKSLYDPKTATKLDPSKFSLFGPMASRFRYDKRLLKAAEIAAARAHAHSGGSCWRYVKDALVTAGMVDSRPKTTYAWEAAQDLTTNFGFHGIRVKDPFKAPLGSVLVYGGAGAGHVELRTKQGFVSDFVSARPSRRPLIGVYVK